MSEVVELAEDLGAGIGMKWLVDEFTPDKDTPATKPLSPQESYLARERKSGAAGSKARLDLEEEKRRRYKEYADTLLGSSSKESLGDPTLSGGD